MKKLPGVEVTGCKSFGGKNAFGIKLDVTVALCESSRVWKLSWVKTGAQIVNVIVSLGRVKNRCE